MGTGWNILIAVLAGVGVVSFIFLGALIVRSAVLRAAQKQEVEDRLCGQEEAETMKMVVWICLAQRVRVGVWCSYIPRSPR